MSLYLCTKLLHPFTNQ